MSDAERVRSVVITDEPALAAAMNTVDRIDALVNSAGIFGEKPGPDHRRRSLGLSGA
jgi:hypothetical protein